MPAFLQRVFRLGLFGLCATLVLTATPGAAASRIKDLADFEGMRTNHLIGYGLVVGLDGTGDSLRNSPFTRQSLESVLEQLGVNTRGQNINTQNTAAVLVTAQLPAFAAQGTRIDVTISALGDAANLLGGQLLVTPLRGADGQVYAVAQGAVTVGGFSVSGEAASVKSNVTTSGRISNGAIVEREIEYELKTQRSLRISLRNPDFTTARRMSEAINTFLGTGAAVTEDPSNVRLTLPDSYQGDMVALITDIEQLTLTPDLMARVVINEQSGTIVMSDSVRVSTVAIAQGNLTIRVTETPQVSQPNPLAGGQTETVPRTQIEVDTNADRKLTVLKTEVTLQSLVDGLNALGIGPRDMMEILQSIKQAGALHADLVVQ